MERIKQEEKKEKKEVGVEGREDNGEEEVGGKE